VHGSIARDNGTKHRNKVKLIPPLTGTSDDVSKERKEKKSNKNVSTNRNSNSNRSVNYPSRDKPNDHRLDRSNGYNGRSDFNSRHEPEGQTHPSLQFRLIILNMPQKKVTQNLVRVSLKQSAGIVISWDI